MKKIDTHTGVLLLREGVSRCERFDFFGLV